MKRARGPTRENKEPNPSMDSEENLLQVDPALRGTLAQQSEVPPQPLSCQQPGAPPAFNRLFVPIAPRPDQTDPAANSYQPIEVVWKEKSTIIPEHMKCEYCDCQMSLDIDLRDARKRYNQIFPFYKCKGCGYARPISGKFDADDAVAEASWPSMKFNSPAIYVKDFDVEYEKKIQRFSVRAQKRKRTPAAVAEETRSEPNAPVAQATVNPRMPTIGEPSTYSFYELTQKVFAVAGKTDSEDAEFNTGMMRELNAVEFMKSLQMLLENGRAGSNGRGG